MTIDNPGAVISTVVHATVSGVGALFCVVAEQPYWLPVFCAAISALPGAYRLYRDHRLKEALSEVERLKRRAELAEGKLVAGTKEPKL